MKRKYLSALLMGVLTLSSVSTFTSCKDYDDDISNLQEQIDKLATADQLSQKVAELQALISSNKSDITSLQSELAKKTTLDEVKAVLANYAEKQYVEDALATLDAAVKAQGGDITALQDAVKAAQAAADKAAEDAKAANAEILETLKTLATKAEVEDVKTAAKAANDAIEALKTGDIKTLQDKQNEILESLNTYAKQESLDKVAAKAEALQTALDKKADTKALTKAEEELNAAIAEVKSTAGENAAAINGLATTVKNAKDALALAQDNQTKLTEALESLKDSSKEGTVAAAIKAIQAQVGTPNKELGTLDTRLAAIESVLNGVKDDDTKLGLATKVTNIENKLKDIIGEYTTMVTEVSLLGSFTSDAGLTEPKNTQLQFVSGKVAQDFTFGKAEKDDKGAVVPSATNQQAFVKGTLFNNKNEILVRVNPTNAVLTKASIKLVDSQGNDLDDILEIGEPKKYEKLLVSQSRATDNTGLWTIPVTVKDGVAKDKVGQLSNGKKILYAVAVNNTNSEAAKDRYVASTYDITVPNAEDFQAATDINKVKIWSVNTMGYDNALTLGYVRGENQVKEYAGGSGTPVSAKNGETIKISFKGLQDKIKYFYVVRDDNHVDGGSGSSAINAWKSYKYEGNAYGNVVEVNPSDPTGELKITINGEVGDEIGFRLFAVNYDGTLTPVPVDGVGGMGFVVNVGADQAKASVTGNVLATDPSSSSTGWLPLTGKLKDGVKLYDTSNAHVTDQFIADNGIKFNVKYSTDGRNAITGTSTKNSAIKYVKFTTDASTPIQQWADDSKANFTIVQKDADGLVENEIAVSLTKKLPTAADVKKVHPYTWKDEQVENGVFTAYVSPADWTAEATTGSFLLNQVITGLDDGFKITIENADKNNATQQYTNPLELTNTDWEVTVDKALINGTTEHKTTISYNYGKVTSAKKNGAYIDHVVPVETVQTVFACPLNKKDQTYAWGQYVAGQDSKGNNIMKDLNYLTFGNPQTVCIKEATYDEHGTQLTDPEYADFLDYIIGTNKFDNSVFGGSLTTLLSGTTKKYVKLEDAKLISAQSGHEDYFNASVDPDTYKITFSVVANAQNPRNDVKSWLVITLKDAFGCDQTYKLPFTVKKRL